MRVKAIVLTLLLALSLTGCTSLLRQSYLSVTPHDKQPAAEMDSSAIRVEDYPQLVSAILYLVSQGEEEGILRLHNYKQDVRADLSAACDEVSHEDPLGAYAVDGVNFSFKRIVSYYEATVFITYRRTPEQIAAVIPVTGSGAIRTVLGDTLAAFAPEVALRVNYFNEDQTYIKGLVRKAYYDAPAFAQGLPTATVSLYPNTGTQRVIEVLLTYPERSDLLLEKSVLVQSAAEALMFSYRMQGQSPAELAAALYEALRTKSDGTGTQATSHAALVSGEANSEGMALGFKLLCDMANLPCLIVEGQNAGESHFWTILELGQEHWHVDPSSPDGLLRSDVEWAGLGYTWDRESYPPCGLPAAIENFQGMQENT